MALGDYDNLMVQYLEDAFPRVLTINHPFLDRISKKKETGRQVAFPVSMGPGGGGAGSFASSLANASAVGGIVEQWQISPQRRYGTVTFNSDDNAFTTGPESAISAMENTTKNAMILAMQTFGGRLGIFSDGYGTLATISVATNISGSLWQITFVSPSDVWNFRNQQVLTQKTTTNGATLDNSGATAVVTAVDQIGNATLGPSITVDVGAGGLVPTAAHFLGEAGTQAASTSPVTFVGVTSWCPPWTSRPLTGAFNNVTRGKYGVASDGFAIDGRGVPIHNAIETLASNMANLENSQGLNLGVCNPTALGKIANAFDTKARSDYRAKGDPDIFYTGITITTPAGTIDMFPEPGCPSNQVILTNGDNWVFGTPTGGNPFRPGASFDGKMFVQDYNSAQARCSVAVQGFLYPLDLAGVGNVLISTN
jgi:hypothetical protein